MAQDWKSELIVSLCDAGTIGKMHYIVDLMRQCVHKSAFFISEITKRFLSYLAVAVFVRENA